LGQAVDAKQCICLRRPKKSHEKTGVTVRLVRQCRSASSLEYVTRKVFPTIVERCIVVFFSVDVDTVADGF
jgi:hypothetical protein